MQISLIYIFPFHISPNTLHFPTITLHIEWFNTNFGFGNPNRFLGFSNSFLQIHHFPILFLFLLIYSPVYSDSSPTFQIHPLTPLFSFDSSMIHLFSSFIHILSPMPPYSSHMLSSFIHPLQIYPDSFIPFVLFIHSFSYSSSFPSCMS